MGLPARRAVGATLSAWAIGCLVAVGLVGPAFAQAVPRRVPASAPRSIRPATILPATANQLAAAMDIPAANFVSATITTSDPAGVGVVTTPIGRFFPRVGGSAALLSTGLATDAETANNSEGTSTSLTGLNNSQGNDLVQLRIVLAPPPGAQCLTFEFAFFSEEFPEFVGTIFNDVFLAELGGSTFTISGSNVSAPLNFAVDPRGNLISINTVFGVTGNTQSTYDAGTPVLRAVTPLGPSAFPQVELVLSITDLGDSIYDSAVLLDNLSFSSTGCAGGTALGDTILSPQSGFITANETFDVVLFAPQPVTQLSVLVNGVNVTGVIATCIPGTQVQGGTTIRCPNISGALLQSLLGPGPYSFQVNAQFQDGSTRSEFVTYQILGPSDVTLPQLAILPSSGLFAGTQRLDLVVVLRADVAGAIVALDGNDVTPLFVNCVLQNPFEPLAFGQGFAVRCPIIGSVLGAGQHILTVNASYADGSTASDTIILEVRANTEP